MKEEVGMKRRGALGALAGWVVVGMLVCSGTSAFGQAEDIYENTSGLTWNWHNSASCGMPSACPCRAQRPPPMPLHPPPRGRAMR